MAHALPYARTIPWGSLKVKIWTEYCTIHKPRPGSQYKSTTGFTVGSKSCCLILGSAEYVLVLSKSLIDSLSHLQDQKRSTLQCWDIGAEKTRHKLGTIKQFKIQTTHVTLPILKMVCCSLLTSQSRCNETCKPSNSQWTKYTKFIALYALTS